VPLQEGKGVGGKQGKYESLKTKGSLLAIA
jgi:hypothetical protein